MITCDLTVVRPDQVTLGVLVSQVPRRRSIDAAVAACGVGERRAGGKLPAHVAVYLTLGLALFADDDYAEFGYAGSGENRSAFPKARVVAISEGCGSRGVTAAATGGDLGVGVRSV